MVKAKHQKLSKKQSQIKKQGKQADTSQFRAQLDALGLRVVEVTADGNCFFRALADQLEGNEEQHQKYRSMVVQHILDNRDTFEPFIEDDVPFDEYCQSMEKDGTWAGHMELQAASLVTHCNMCIHRNMSPRWYIRNFDDRGARMIHLIFVVSSLKNLVEAVFDQAGTVPDTSYHDGEHYNSVRLKDDPCDGPARSIVIKADADLSATSQQAKVTANKSRPGAGREIIQPGSIKVVMAGSGCEDAEKVEQTLVQVNGDVDAAIEFLIAEKGAEECSAKSDSLPCQEDTSYGGDEHEKYELRNKDAAEETTNNESNDSSRKTNDNSRLQPNDTKNIPRNKVCPCGSKKKYKACCGSASGKHTAKVQVNQAADSKRSKRERKQGKKGVLATPYENDGGPPDMGALCI